MKTLQTTQKRAYTSPVMSSLKKSIMLTALTVELR